MPTRKTTTLPKMKHPFERKKKTYEQRIDTWLKKRIAECEVLPYEWTWHGSAPKYNWHLTIKGHYGPTNYKMTIQQKHRLCQLAPHLKPPPRDVEDMNADQLRAHV